MLTTLAPPSSWGRRKEDRNSSVVYCERVDSYSSPLEAGRTEPLLTGRRVPAKTESVSESVDKITGECLRLQLFCMPPKNRQTDPRKQRYDAQLNHKRIIKVAHREFTTSVPIAIL